MDGWMDGVNNEQRAEPVSAEPRSFSQSFNFIFPTQPLSSASFVRFNSEYSFPLASPPPPPQQAETGSLSVFHLPIARVCSDDLNTLSAAP